MTIKTSILKWGITIILLFTALLYIKAIFNGFAWDDEIYIKRNPYLLNFSLEGIKNIFSTFYFSNYHPLTTLTYLSEYKLFGLNPLPYHILNVLIHMLNTWLVYKLTKLLSGKKLTAFVVSFLFAVHPMHVESVAWIAERKDMLYSLFYLLSLFYYIKYIAQENKRKYYTITLLLFIASLLSKSAAVTLPVLLLAVDIYKKRKINLQLFLEKIPFFMLSLLFGIIAIKSQQGGGAINSLTLSYNFFERMFLFTYSISFYIIKFLVPVNLSIMHYFPDITSEPLPWYYYASMPFLLLLLLPLLKKFYLRKEIIFGLMFFLIAVSVMLQLIPVGSAIVSERYTYIAYIGLFYIAGQGISEIRKEKIQNRVLVIFVLFILAFSFQTWQRIGVWKNGDVLFTDAIEKNSDNYNCYRTRGDIRNVEGNIKGALQDYDKTLKYKLNKSIFVVCLVNRGDVLNKLNNYSEALKSLNVAISLDTTLADAYFCRGKALDGLDSIYPALRDYNNAIKLSPALAEAYNNRAVIKAKTGDLNGSLKDVNKSIELIPENVEAYNNRGNIKTLMKDYKGSVEDFTHSLTLKPNEKMVYYNRGISRFYLNDLSGACNDWQMSLNLGNNLAEQMLREYCK